MRKSLMTGLAVVAILFASQESASAKNRNRNRNRVQMMPSMRSSQPTYRTVTPTAALSATPAASATTDSTTASTQPAENSSGIVQASAVKSETSAVQPAAAKVEAEAKPEPVKSGWMLAAEMEARSGGPTTHAYSAGQLASIAGHPGASVFVGVGMNGMTCRPGYGTLVAETTINGKTVRIWLR